MPTIQDVAKAAGVSISTVSYVLSGSRPISPATKQRIHQAMAAIGYQPNALAKGLASRRSRIIALLMSPGDRDLGSTEMEFVSGAARAARAAGYHLVLWADSLESPADLAGLGGNGLVEAVLLMEVKLQDWRLAVLQGLGIPFALIGRPADPSGLDWVDIDFDRTIADAMLRLEAAGHRNFLLVNQSRQSHAAGYGPVVRILESYRRHCAERGLVGESVFCDSDAPAGLGCIQRAIADWPRTTAVLAMNDHALPGIMHGLQAAGRHIPDDISLVALLCSRRTANHYWPPLSIMEIPGAELGHLGITRLIGRIEEAAADPLTPSLIPCQWLERGTTGPAAGFVSKLKGES